MWSHFALPLRASTISGTTCSSPVCIFSVFRSFRTHVDEIGEIIEGQVGNFYIVPFYTIASNKTDDLVVARCVAIARVDKFQNHLFVNHQCLCSP